MSRKRTVRRVWSTEVNPIVHAAFQCSLLSLSEWNTQMVPVLAAVHALSTGDWSPQDNWQPMFESLMRIESMLKLKHMPDHGFIANAQETYTICLARMDRTGATAFKADELATIREVAQVYGDLLKEVSHGEFAKACDHAFANVDRVMKSKVSLSSRQAERLAA